MKLINEQTILGNMGELMAEQDTREQIAETLDLVYHRAYKNTHKAITIEASKLLKADQILNLKVSRERVCPERFCDKGQICHRDNEWQDCPTCNGTGTVVEEKTWQEILASVRVEKDSRYWQAVKDDRAGNPLDLTEEEFEIYCTIKNQGYAEKDKEIEAKISQAIGLAVSHLWQFAKGTGHPLNWEISETDRMSVLKHYGVHYLGDNCPTCGGKCKAKYIKEKDNG